MTTMRIAYESWKPGVEAQDVLREAHRICTDYAQQGYDLTLRQLYYQFVSRALIPNNQRSYDRLGTIVNRGRMAGILDWDFIVDRTRNLRSLSHWNNPGAIIDSAAASFALDKWSDQPTRVEVWVEKEALAGVVEQVAARWDCPWFSCRGYVSQSEMWGAAQRIGRYIAGGQACTILHLGDHDPSGIDMTRDITDRLTTFLSYDWSRGGHSSGSTTFGGIAREMATHCDAEGDAFSVHRIALNMDQVEQYDPPPNPAKLTDSRARDYVELYGSESWELDALDPSTLDDLIESHVLDLMDNHHWETSSAQEADYTATLQDAASRWQEVAAFLRGES